LIIKVAGIQISCSDDIERNIQKALRSVDHAVESGAELLCFSQLFFLPWFLRDHDPKAMDLAVSVEHESLERFRDSAREHEVVLVCPFFEKKEDKTFSSAVVFDKDGSTAGIYQKAHIPDIPDWRETSYFLPGETGFPVMDTSCGKIGIQLCWDNFFPEGTRALALNGAEIIFAPTAAAYASQEKWLHVISANAFVNNLFLFRVNRVGHDRGLDFYGQSFCVNPLGEMAAEPVGMQESIVLADVDRSMVSEVREKSGFLRDRRTSLYKPLL
jgi:N-carbamoylputrescine amidase